MILPADPAFRCPSPFFVDTHCHLTHARFGGEVAEVVERAIASGVRQMVTIGTGIEDALAARELTRRFPGCVYATAGLDPFSAHAVGDGFDDAFANLAELLRGGGYCGVGEIGLDYHYDLDPRAVQAARLERQLDLARSLDLPAVLHVRDAHEEMLALLAGHSGSRGVVHSFTAGPAEVERYLQLGWHLAFNGIATFPRSQDLRHTASRLPIERLLVETDSPYLAPVPHRGRRCEPAFVVDCARALAEARSEPLESLATATTANARRLFGLPDPLAD